VPDFGTLSVGNVIVHQLPRGRCKPGEPHGIDLMDAEVELSDIDRGFMDQKLRQVLEGWARDVVEDQQEESPVPAMVRNLVSATPDLVKSSQTMAILLRQLQAPISPQSLLMVATATIDGVNSVVLAKVDHEQGMRMEQFTLKDGRRTYRAQFLRDLILGQGTNVFKAAAFLSSGMQEGSPLSGHVVDEQRRAGTISDYFLEFLGCVFVVQPRVLTQRFFDSVQKWIRTVAKDDPETLASYEVALLAEMQSHNRRLSPTGFANAHLESEHRDEFLNWIQAAGIPRTRFPKDTDLITSEIRRVKVQTARNATLLVPPDMYEDGSLTIEQLDDTRSRVTVEDAIRSITGASGRKSG
jgi:hypothetical protein